MNRNEVEWSGMNRNELEWTGMNRNDTGMDRNDTGMTPEWTGMKRNYIGMKRNDTGISVFCKKSLLLLNVLICVPKLKVFKSIFSYACFIIICCWSGGLIRFATIFISQSPIPPPYPCRRITWYAKNNLFLYVRSTCRTFQWPTLKKGWRKLTTMMSQPKKTTGKL